MDANLKAAGMKRLECAAAALRRNGFDAEVFTDRGSAMKAVLALIGGKRKVGLGGCMTAAELGLPKALEEAGNEIITHTPE
ncbi:MAG TPA: LUD domain-containing protein, partial [Elusimicrobiales bacterium]|nr:LUD domain-containing protein [Elusimicrobiales bacterium]